MATQRLARIVQDLRGLAASHHAAEATDGDLLARFSRQRDAAAFEALVRRHGPMVRGVCQRVLRDPNDADDAFQATFLVLVRKAGSLCAPAMVGNWLHGVAYRIALQARHAAAKRRDKEAHAMVPREAPEEIWVELRPLLDQELDRLPAKHRTIVLLCDLEGKTRKETAHLLGCPEGTVASRLARARAMLAKRLARHVPGLASSSLGSVLAQNATSAGVPPSLLSSTVQAAGRFAAGSAAGLVPGKVLALTEGVLKTMLLKRLVKSAAFLTAIVFLATGTCLAIAASRAPASNEEERPEPPTQTDPKAALSVTCYQLLLDYQANEAAADEKFGSKAVQVKVSMSQARVKRLQPADIDDWMANAHGKRPYYVLHMHSTGRGFTGGRTLQLDLVLGFGEDAQKQLAALTHLQIVTVEGQCLGRTTTQNNKEIVCIKNCKIIEVAEDKAIRGVAP